MKKLRDLVLGPRRDNEDVKVVEEYRRYVTSDDVDWGGLKFERLERKAQRSARALGPAVTAQLRREAGGRG